MNRNLKCFVSVENVTEPLLGRPIQETLGLNVINVLEAACDRYGGNCNADDLLEIDKSKIGPVARVLSEEICHRDPGNDQEYAHEQRTELGEDTTEELDAALHNILRAAKVSGISSDGHTMMDRLLNTYRDVFKVNLVPGPPAKVAPMKVELLPNCIPFRAKLRRYPPEQREYLKRFTNKLIEYGFAKENHHAEWASAPLLVPKTGTKDYRTTFDLRMVNKATRPTTWPMPHIQSEILDFQHSTVFASIEFCAGYWQMPLDPALQNYNSFITSTGVFQPTRTLQGATNSAQNFQSRVEPCFQSLRSNFKAWFDDFALHAEDDHTLLRYLEAFFKIYRTHNLRISAKKSRLFNKSLRYCGYVIDKERVQCDPRRLSALPNGHEPTNVVELSQFVNCLQWMANFILSFSRRVAPLNRCLEKAYELSGKRTTKYVRDLSLQKLGWSARHSNAFTSLTLQLEEAVKLAHRDSKQAVCVYTDASEEHWASVVTQCNPHDLRNPLNMQIHQPLAFLGGSFNSTQRNWTTFEQEVFAVFMNFEKMDYMFTCENDIHIFTDHRNLLFVFSAHAIAPTLGRHVVNKVQRWTYSA